MPEAPATPLPPCPLNRGQRFTKRAFDLLASAVLLLLFGWLICLVWLLATLDTGRGLFVQERVGRGGRLFPLLKIRTMRREVPPGTAVTNVAVTHVTTARDARITRLGAWLRRLKLDELPQLLNVLCGHMSFVGPRPDVPGFADRLEGEDRVLLTVRPGITGPATLHFRREEDLLAAQDDPERYNREVIWPEKVRLNRRYLAEYRFLGDLAILWRTVTG